ncbi:hypothetical protein [Bacillus sp. B15-48]|uniref:hypothetical protein n=1 Tax=Bacillus sp. B15-48 TaxID=1548601 RepID=UPI00193FB2E8|nr:hypothetical protein [Bacillus sp. B15-48]MBM4765107.1 hypothetical protein [Bacillus sp. B15-48]
MTNGIIKRRKTTDFAQIHNQVLQNLTDIRTIGLIAHLMSMPADWAIKKTHLYSKFGRGPVTTAIAELEKNNYWVHITYRDGKKNLHYYQISDSAFTAAEVSEMIKEVSEAGYKITHISESFLHLITTSSPCLTNGEEEASSSVDFLKSKMDCPNSTVENKQLLNKEKQRNKKQINNHQTNIVNLQATPNPFFECEQFEQALTTACHALYSQYAPGRWSKNSWHTLIDTFVKETVEAEKHNQIPIPNISAYAEAAIRNMTHAFDQKTARLAINKNIPTRPVPFYNWLINEVEDSN